MKPQCNGPVVLSPVKISGRVADECCIAVLQISSIGLLMQATSQADERRGRLGE
jgi:hypothetical protein